ncbi:acetaldehyde dehydrogenase (acetylating) [Clostridium botulinum]|uniref:acetaldehyde dehydrogenase (acetylating) n=2 Tax=Clostridium botulinum TaxID=1491 RepID=UPI000A1728C7|nr:acetaldehyde dehydrogenase (acetylating) [Clostridium botulinum]MBY6799882.1 acetaldehyde dehydrogenase (acetylating) [Clostridium botulinum]NFF19956.1 acetaldehyde dehydrogenase (acetylating) [Clostridium botulinum]NFM73977.1 acetaldehyde dehydrogenase (acetylating) [Clostridium botulinum]NFP79127.1 acetaldehyde dehydrogenase (acetylating) [Clostridium botulinum]NFP93814.1 acetaldehyde dehydrogenase (acetylating) [Clostridium botulinum]
MENFDKDLRSIQQARDLARLGKVAADKIADYTEEQIDKILRNMVRVAEENAVCLAQMAVEETGFGIVEDKTFKNHLAATILYNSIKDMKTIGIIKEDETNKLIEIAEPVGLVMGIVPSTNPTSTAIFKAMISIKSRNAIVFAPHPAAAKCTTKAVELMRDAAIEAGAPENIISAVTIPTIGATNELMKSKEVAIIIATGGPGMVKAAYSSGTPAIGVGAGNSPAYIERTANVEKAVKNIIASKTFDNGTICASEQSIICEECNHDLVVAEFKKQGGYFMTAEETEKVCKLLFKKGNAMNAKFVGRSPQVIASAAGFTIPAGTKVLIGRQNGVGEGYPLSFEKLTTVLGFYTVKDWHEACELSIKLLQNGIGHTMSIHTEDRDMVMKFARKPASRILVNTGGTQGGTGASTGLNPSFTLGCGTWGGSSVSENVTPEHLINVKRVAYGIKDCTNLASNDPTFNCIKTVENCHGVQNQFMNMSPAQIAAAAEVLNKANNCAESSNTCTECNSENGKNEELLDLVNQIVAAMKGAN